MKKIVCAVYFPGVISLLNFLPQEEFDIIITENEIYPIDSSAAKIITNEGMKYVLNNQLKYYCVDYYIGYNCLDNPEIAKDRLKKMLSIIRLGERCVEINRKTKETEVYVKIDLDNFEEPKVSTGVKFFDHMLEQIAYHGRVFLEIKVLGDIDVDEHHTIEDVGIVLGDAFFKALGSKMGVERYGFVLPMDESKADVSIDFGGRGDLVWDVSFSREKIGDMPTEMFKHFFKSFSNSAKCTLNVSASGENEHHKIEAIFKAFARAFKMAIKRDISDYKLYTSKGIL